MTYETLILAKYEGEEKEEQLADCRLYADCFLASLKWLAHAAEALDQNLEKRFGKF